MKNSSQIRDMAVSELGCLSKDEPAVLHELIALRAARDHIEELLNVCVTELRANPLTAPSWASIAYALGSPSASAARQRHGSVPLNIDADQQVISFWRTFAEQFVWDFLPGDFLHALYEQWMSTTFANDTPLLKKALTRRLKVIATASGGWSYSRSRPGSLISDQEPLAARVPHWSRGDTDAAIYGFRRNGV